MKKIIAAVAACIMVMSLFTGCFGTGNTNTSLQIGESKVKFSDEFKQLQSYMKKKGYLTSEMIKNATDTKLPSKAIDGYKYGYEMIGAESGKKYANGNIVIELYEFKEGEQNDYVDSVKKDGTFTLYDKEVTAYLTDDDKFMLVYTDKSIKEGDTSSDAYKAMQKAVKVFKKFKPEDATETKSTEETTTEETTKETKSSTSSKTS